MTEALSEIQAMLAEYEARAEARRQESADGMRELVAMLEHRLAHSSPSVVTQDLVPVATYEAAQVLFDNILGDAGSYAEFGYPSYREAAVRTLASAIEAAQIAAVKAALAYVEELAHDHRVIEACLIQAINPADIVRDLLTPLQQEREG